MHSQLVLAVFVTLLSCASLVLAIGCPTGTFFKNNRCIPCPPGTFNMNSNSTSCTECFRGTYNPVPGGESTINCLDCPSGTFSKDRATKCTPCPPGKFSRESFDRCLTCPPGSALAGNDESCEKCPPAWYRPAGTPSTICLFCPSGTGSRRGATSCKKCPKGTYRDKQFVSFFSENEMVGCRECPKNTFADGKGGVQCKLCPLGTIADETGAQNCKSCPAGTFRGRIQQKRCKACPARTNSRGKKPAGCRHSKKGCPVNTFEDRRGECRACMPGERLDVRRKRCVPCGKRQVSLGGVSTKCQTCPQGQRPANANTIFEKSRCECKDGTVSDGAGGCKKCPPGTFRTNPPGPDHDPKTFTRVEYYQEPSCEKCKRGRFNDKPGMTECKLCPEGMYSNLPGSTRCMKCPDGFISRASDPIALLDSEYGRVNCLNPRTGCGIEQFLYDGDSCAEAGCKPNTFFNEEFEDCTSCFSGEFFDSEKRECVECPPGQTNPIGLFETCEICPKGATATYDGRCACLGMFEDDGNGGCRKCMPGEVSLLGKCAPCGEDSFYRKTKDRAECVRCERNTIKLETGHRRCTKCPKGFKKERDVFGEEVNWCVPRDLYPVST